MGKRKLTNLVYKLTRMNYKKIIYELHKFITQNQNLQTIHANLFLQHNFDVMHLVPCTSKMTPNKIKIKTKTTTNTTDSLMDPVRLQAARSRICRLGNTWTRYGIGPSVKLLELRSSTLRFANREGPAVGVKFARPR
jgi:hypothetical protein